MAAADGGRENNSRAGWWAAGVLAALMVGGAGTFYANLNGPSRAQVDRIDDRQDLVLQRLAVIEERLDTGDGQREEMERQLRELRALLTQHASDVGARE